MPEETAPETTDSSALDEPIKHSLASANPLNPLPKSVDSNPLPNSADNSDPTESKLDEFSSEIDGWISSISQNISRSLIKNSDLPQASRDRLLTQTFTTPEEVTAAIDSERLYLARLQEDTVINLPGAPPRSPNAKDGAITGMRTSLDQLTLALDALLAGTRPPDIQPLTGLRELYHLLSGDYEMTGLYHPDRVSLAQALCRRQ